MKLIIANRVGTNGTSINLLTAACEKFGVELVEIDCDAEVPEFDASEKYMLYRLPARSLAAARTLFRSNMCVSLENFDYHFARDQALDLAGVSTPPTVALHNLDPEYLKSKVAQVGGFPLIIKDKIPGGHGIGVVKAETMESLEWIGRMIFDTTKKKSFRIEEFLPHTQHARIIVLGDTVIDSIAYHGNDYDFRTNRSDDEINVEPMKFSPEMEETAIHATHASGFEFGGVDMIVSGDRHQVLEVNYPCYFPRAEECSGVKTSEKLVEYLIAKADYTPAKPAKKAAKRTPPTLVLINSPGRNVISTEFRKLAKYKNIEVIEIDPNKPKTKLPAKGRFLLYRIATTPWSKVRAQEIALYRENDCTSFAGEYPVLSGPAYRRNGNYRDAKISFVPKVPLTRKNVSYLREKIDDVGGLPILVSNRDAQQTALRVDTFDGFLSLVDYAQALSNRLSIQPFINVKHFGRMVVLGEKIISSTEYLAADSDTYAFRKFDLVVARDYGQAASDLAVRAAQNHGLACAAVNVLIDVEGAAFVEDVIFPFNYRADQDVTGVNIGERMLDHLLMLHGKTHG